MAQLVNPYNVVLTDNPSRNSIRQMERVLERQGQIEPLQVRAIRKETDGTILYAPFESDAWGSEIVVAVRNLGWDTILVHVTNRYEF